MAAANEVIDDVTGKLRKAQDLLEATTREVILARRERDRARDAGTEAAHALESAREAFAAELGQVQAASMRALEATQKEQKSETGKEVRVRRFSCMRSRSAVLEISIFRRMRLSRDIYMYLVVGRHFHSYNI